MMQINQNWKRQFLILVDLNVSNAKISEIESKIPSISGLATNTALTAIENKNKPDFNTKITDIEKKLIDHNHDTYITTPEFNKLTAEVFDVRLALANIVRKTDFYTKLKSLNKRINSNKTKHLLVEN